MTAQARQITRQEADRLFADVDEIAQYLSRRLFNPETQKPECMRNTVEQEELIAAAERGEITRDEFKVKFDELLEREWLNKS